MGRVLRDVDPGGVRRSFGVIAFALATLSALVGCSAGAADPAERPRVTAHVSAPTAPAHHRVAFLPASSQLYTTGSGTLSVGPGETTTVRLVRLTDGEVSSDGAVGLLWMSESGDGLFIAGHLRPGLQRTSAAGLHVVAVTKTPPRINTDSGAGECLLRLRRVDSVAVVGRVACRAVPDAGGDLVSFTGRFSARSARSARG